MYFCEDCSHSESSTKNKKSDNTMSLVSWVFNRLMSMRMKRIEYFMKNPYEVQEKTLKDLLHKAHYTEWGKKYNYSSINTTESYQKNVPISTYEELFPYIERLLKGEQYLLWHEPILCFSKSSGTTNARSKFIPVSPSSLEQCHYKGGKDMFALYVDNYSDAKLFAGKALAVGGSYQNNPQNPASYYGDVSALIMKNLPSWAEWKRTPSLEIALMDNWEFKLEKMAEATLKEDVTCIQGVPTWTIFLIRKIVEMSGKKNILDVWQNLECFFHGAVAFDPYRSLFKELIPSEKMRYMEVYNASEGFFGLQDQKSSSDMLLLLDYGVYYEFLPIEELENGQSAKTVTLDKVELNKNYAVIISTNSGLWRYNIGDTVRFTSLNPFRIRISGRTKHFINAFGEEVVVENAENALTEACEVCQAIVANFTAAPIYIGNGEKGGHEWIIEFEKKPDNLEKFIDVLDNSLRRINSDYDAKRTADIALLRPIIHAAPVGTFYEWMRKRNKLGGQNKVPRLSNNREYVDDILKITLV